MTDAPGYRETTANEILCAELDDGAVTERIRLRNSLAEATARAEQAEAERGVLAKMLAAISWDEKYWLEQAAQEAAKQGNDKL